MLFSEKVKKNCGQACQTVDKSTQKHPHPTYPLYQIYQIYPLQWTNWIKDAIYP